MSSELKKSIISFDTSKKFKFIKELGSGGTGETMLFLDESIDMLFAIKKYAPKGNNDVEDCYKRFIDEIKILFNVYHKNIVRIYNYYLYPECKTGYIQMEYITGTTIDEIEPSKYGKSWNDYFISAIEAFDYLYEKNVLHRDIRTKNFMINDEGELKIIDFGFGKVFSESNQPNSVCLNWPATIHPEEVERMDEYNFSTEIYYIGEMFKNLTKNDPSFLYDEVLKKMLEYSPEKRYKNYKEIKSDISGNLLNQIKFTDEEKIIYINFADSLIKCLNYYLSIPMFKYNITEVKTSIENLLKKSSLERYVQDNKELILCFIKGNFSYKIRPFIETEILIKFYELLVKLDDTKKCILIDTLYVRLNNIKITSPEEDIELPF